MNDIQLDNNYKNKLNEIFEYEGDILFIIPPISVYNSTTLGCPSLVSVLKSNGIKARIFYADILFSYILGKNVNNILEKEYMSPYTMIIEKIFYESAFGEEISIEIEDPRVDIKHLKNSISEWKKIIKEYITKCKYKIVACSTSHQQNLSSITIINLVKSIRTDIITVLGGGNCDGNMAYGIQSLSPNIDFIFSGESEIEIVNFFLNLKKLEKIPKIINCKEVENLNLLPLPDFSDFFSQKEALNLKNDEMWLPYESSRCCWYGEKNRCTFCGIDGSKVSYRSKKANIVLEHIKELIKKYNIKKIQMTDTLMPHEYLKDLFPQFDKEKIKLEIFYEQKVGLKFSQVFLLKSNGVKVIQAGIEALSSSLLKKLNKGTSIFQNISFLRFTTSLNCIVLWNLLYEIPGDEKEEWESVRDMIPNLVHLFPPISFRKVEITRFSPYFLEPDKYGISNIKPLDIYYEIYPKDSNISLLAWIFNSDYSSASRVEKELIYDIRKRIDKWRQLWIKNSIPPKLEVVKENNKFYIIDTRFLKNNEKQSISDSQAARVLFEEKKLSMYDNWALKNKYCISINDRVVPLATTKFEIYQELKKKFEIW